MGAELGAPTAQVASGAAPRLRVDTGEEQEEVREVNDELTVATQERTGATMEPRRSARMRVDERRVGREAREVHRAIDSGRGGSSEAEDGHWRRANRRDHGAKEECLGTSRRGAGGRKV